MTLPTAWNKPVKALGLMVALALIGFTAVSLLQYAGWPWNLMRNQLAIRPQERPPLGLPPGAVPFSLEQWVGLNAQTPAKEVTTQTGEQVYRTNCIFCHGTEGRGDGPIASKLRQPPTDLVSWKVQWRKEADLIRLIEQPIGIMPPFHVRLDKKQFRSVVHYIHDTLAPEQTPPWQAAKGQAPAVRGRILYEALDCTSCHGSEHEKEASGIPPSLEFAGSKLQKQWIEQYLLAPHPIRWKADGVRPRVRMPAFRLETKDAEALAQYLALRVDERRFPTGVLEGQGDIQNGQKAFAAYQCRGCHTLNGTGNRIGPDLSHVASRLHPAYLYQYLLDPQAIVPGTAMKNFELWDDEARALVRYLETLR
ncbi:MAG: c-type cytochrome [Pirellulaceae bacterium]